MTQTTGAPLPHPDQDRHKGAIEGDRPNDWQHGNPQVLSEDLRR